MRLLNTRTGRFEEKNPEQITYAILSHTWDEIEQTFQDVREIQRSPTRRAGFHSLDFSCAVARENGYDYLWIDSCCIDKTSSSELSEAINSMYDWYRSVAVCYAYLSDVPFGEKHRAGSSRFRSSRWFKRGWTLQERIAPSALTFLSEDWKVIGTKGSLCDLVEDVTSIPEEALLHTKPLDLFSVAERFSWAATRQTTTTEDRAYSLLGIFAIHMPTLYGEGELAFQRLQEEVVQRIPDQSLFAWSHVYLSIKPG
ncbi:HET-domain-containing protein [Dichomitus squalens LYAD-421 SS1]|uniref:HET-domain-containing protein n=1 Tax=Dichomitus squalens (strain LYAD-421) TaxID=732165 RepID=R7SR08_DICSQ|nr:HET-domain-containing protein [Dichomitus squalens LYAD-421 SS1]EJF58378.1 HET-domain-containing protein [Dichomitus squalens LYAD-421 SS1]